MTTGGKIGGVWYDKNDYPEGLRQASVRGFLLSLMRYFVIHINGTNDSKFEIAVHEGEQFEQESIGASDAIERLATLERMLNDWFAAPV